MLGWFRAPKAPQPFTVRFAGPTGHPLVMLTANYPDAEFDEVAKAYGKDPVNELATSTFAFDGPHKTHCYFFSHRLGYTRQQVAVFGHELAHQLHRDYRLTPDTTDAQRFGKDVRTR